MKLSEASVQELQAEIARRVEQERFAAEQRRAKRAELILANSDTLLQFVQHSRSSCSDENTINAERCNRCALLEAKTYGAFCGDSNFSVTISLDD